MQVKQYFCAGAALLSLAAAAQAQVTSLFGSPGAVDSMIPTPVAHDSAFSTVLDGRFGEQYNGPGTRNAIIHRKPYFEADRSLTIDSVKIQNVTNQKALDITAARLPDGTYRAFNQISVKNYETDMVARDGRFPGLHIDHLRIAGGGWKQDVKTDVYLENIHLKGGDAVPLLVQDGIYGTVHLKNVKLSDTDLGSVQISTKGAGSIDRVIIEDSPGLKVALMERDDTIGEIQVIDSPGASYDVAQFRTLTPDGSHIFDVENGDVFSSAASWRKIGTLDNWADSSFDGASVAAPGFDGWQGGGWSVAALPEPGLVGLLPLAGLLLKRRKRT